MLGDVVHGPRVVRRFPPEEAERLLGRQDTWRELGSGSRPPAKLWASGPGDWAEAQREGKPAA